MTRTYERKGTPCPPVTRPGSDEALAPVYEVVHLRRLADDLFADLGVIVGDNHRLVVENRVLWAAARQYRDAESILLATITRLELARPRRNRP